MAKTYFCSSIIKKISLIYGTRSTLKKNFFLNYFRYLAILPDGDFLVIVNRPNEWIHTVVNFSYFGIYIYWNGRHKRTQLRKYRSKYPHEGNGRIAVNRLYSGYNGFYGSVKVDELFFFNKRLNATEIKIISNSA